MIGYLEKFPIVNQRQQANKRMKEQISRKEKRKQERLDKKQKKNKRQRIEHGKTLSNESFSKEKGSLQQKRPHSRRQHVGYHNKTTKEGFQNKFFDLIEETVPSALDQEEDEEHDTMKQKNKSKHHQIESLSVEDRQIKALESKLGLGSLSNPSASESTKAKSLKKLKNEYAKDGLGDDFVDFLSGLDRISQVVKASEKKNPKHCKENQEVSDEESDEESGQEESDEEMSDLGMNDDGNDDDDDDVADGLSDMDEETRKEFLLLQQEDAEFLKGMDNLPTDESESDDDDEEHDWYYSEESDEEQDEEVLKNTQRNQTAQSKQGATQHDEESEEEEEELEESEQESEEEEEEEEEVVEEEEEEEEEEVEVEESEESEEEEEEKPEYEEDIYGRTVLKSSKDTKAPSAYIPPHLRKLGATSASQDVTTTNKVTAGIDEQVLRELNRRINGQLNRISESNMESICLELEILYRENVRSVVNQILLDKIIQTCVHKRQVMTPLIRVCTALIGGLYHSVGTEVGGFMIEKIVQQLHTSVQGTQEDDEEEEVISSKEPLNLLLMVGMLYNFGVVHCGLVYDLFRSFVDTFSNVDIELIHQLLKTCGYPLRSDDADALKEMIAMVQEKALTMEDMSNDTVKQQQQQKDDILSTSSSQKKTLSQQFHIRSIDQYKKTHEEHTTTTMMTTSEMYTPEQAEEDKKRRIRFILDLIYDLKKNKKTKSKRRNSTTSSTSMTNTNDVDGQLRKWMGRVKTRCSNANNALRVSLKELLNADKDGRWWIVGGTWVGYQQPNNTQDKTPRKVNNQDNRLLRLAEKQRMNTDVRRKVFVAIMGANDCVDAYDRLLKLHLKEKQQREIVRVLIHCCGQEKKFNPYYVLLAQKICEMDHRFQFTFQLAFWDVFKQLDTFKPRKVYNLATMLSLMIQSNKSLSLSVLKVLDFTDLNSQKYALLFLRTFFEKILKMDNEHEIYQVFERLVQSKKPTLVLDGIAVFLHQHMMNKVSSSDQLLKKRLKMVQSLLDQLTKRATLQQQEKDWSGKP